MSKTCPWCGYSVELCGDSPDCYNDQVRAMVNALKEDLGFFHENQRPSMLRCPSYIEEIRQNVGTAEGPAVDAAKRLLKEVKS